MPSATSSTRGSRRLSRRNVWQARPKLDESASLLRPPIPLKSHAPDELSAEADRTAYRERLDAFLVSRDVGNALTLDALRAGIRLETVISAAANVAQYADDALEIVNNEYSPPLNCKEGCSYCCCKPGVLTSIPEFLRILKYIKSTFSADAISTLNEHARQYAAQMEGRSFNDLVDESVPCPLLVDGRCSVYEFRPLVCRGYNSTNVNACRRAHEDTSVLVPIFSVLKDVTDGATVGAAQCLKAAGFNDSLVDLGTALSIALAAGDGFSEAVIDGGKALLPAEDASWVEDLWTRVRETARRVGIKQQSGHPRWL
jgi:Fe-S-cluster containining protein